MASLQYVIDSICSSVTVECVYKMIDGMLTQGMVTIDEIVPLVQSKDHSLDIGSARLIVKTAADDLAQKGNIRLEGEKILPTDLTSPRSGY
jgi:hypothetical protein